MLAKNMPKTSKYEIAYIKCSVAFKNQVHVDKRANGYPIQLLVRYWISNNFLQCILGGTVFIERGDLQKKKKKKNENSNHKI